MTAGENKGILQRGYYDHPEGEDIMGKMIATNKWALAIGVGFSTVDVLLYSHTKGYMATMARYLKFTGPLVGATTAFTVGTFMCNKLRAKDDNLNYMVGACAAGGVLGAAMRCPRKGLAACGAFCLAAWVKRLSLKEGWAFFPPVTQCYGNIRSVKRDWSVVGDGERGWTR